MFATLSRLAVSVLFSWYTANFGSDNKTWGSLGAVIGRLHELEALLYRNLVRCRAWRQDVGPDRTRHDGSAGSRETLILAHASDS